MSTKSNEEILKEMMSKYEKRAYPSHELSHIGDSIDLETLEDALTEALTAKDKWWNKHEQDMYETLEATHREEKEAAVREAYIRGSIDAYTEAKALVNKIPLPESDKQN